MLTQEDSSMVEPIHINSFIKLPNYSSFVELLKQKLSAEHSKKTFTALLFIEFDDLAYFNDTFGFNIDEILTIKLNKKLSLFLNSKDILAKVGNHQYIIMQDLSSFETPEILAKRILHMLSEPFVVNENMFYIHASIGISLFPVNGDNAYKLIKKAKSAMKNAQKNGTNHIAFSHQETIASSYEKSIRIMADLPAAIENGEIYFLYQPQYSYSEKRFSGAEMLARWIHPEYGEVSPEFFIPLAEKNGMIGSLTIKALVDASKAFTLFKSKNINDFYLSVNISPIFLMTSAFYKTIKFLMEQYYLQGEKLNFEITEDVLMNNTDHLIKTLKKLKKLDIGIEMDDFGTGYTSLKHLASLPIDTLKVDQSFISGIDKDVKKKTLFKAISDMAHALNINLIAEGVENSSEEKVIKVFESITAQGYFYSKPIHLDTLVEKLK